MCVPAGATIGTLTGRYGDDGRDNPSHAHVRRPFTTYSEVCATATNMFALDTSHDTRFKER